MKVIHCIGQWLLKTFAISRNNEGMLIYPYLSQGAHYLNSPEIHSLNMWLLNAFYLYVLGYDFERVFSRFMSHPSRQFSSFILS